METMEDAPPSEEAAPSTVGSPKTVMSNGILKKGNEDTPATNDNFKEADHDTPDAQSEPSKTIVGSVADEEPPKSKTKPQKSNRRKGRKPNSTKSSLEPFEPVMSNQKMEVVNTPEHQENYHKDVDDIQREDPDVDTAEVAHHEKPSEVPDYPETSDDARLDISSSFPIGSLADETRSKKTEREKKKERPNQEDKSTSDVDSKKESDTKQDSEGATGLESTLNKCASKKPSSASDQEESVPDCTDNTKKEDDNINKLDGTAAKDLVQEAGVWGSQRVNKKKRGQTKATPVKGHTKTPAMDDRKKVVPLPKSTPKAIKHESGMEAAPRSTSKRKLPGEVKASQTKVYGSELVGAKVEVWWPDDKKFYKGVVKSFDSAEKMHKIFYDNGDVEVLNLENEKWKLVDDFEGHASDGGSPDESADEAPKGKKAKTNVDPGTRQRKSVSSTKTSGASSSKSKAMPKSGSGISRDGKSKSSKSGNKSSDYTPKPTQKSEDEDEETPIGNIKSKQGTSKGASSQRVNHPRVLSNPIQAPAVKLKLVHRHWARRQ